MSKKKLEKHINDFIIAFLEFSPDFRKLDDEDKLYVYSVLKKLLGLIYQVIRYPNVYPILLVQNSISKTIIEKAFAEIEEVIPRIKDIKIHVMN